MHVLLVHQAFASPQEAGSTRHYEIAQHLVKSGHKVTIIASKVHYRTGALLSDRRFVVDKEVTPDGIHLWRTFAYAPLHKSLLHMVVAFVSFAASSFLAGLQVADVDVVWATSPPLVQVITTYWVARVRRVPFVLELRDLWPDSAVALHALREPITLWLARCIERYLYRHADHCVINSPGFVSHLRSCGVPEDRISLVTQGVETSLFRPEDRGEEFRKRYDLEGCFVVMYAGAHGLANDLHMVLRAAEMLADHPTIRFVLVGHGRLKADLERTVAERNIRTVIFVPPQPKEEMPAVLAAADVCLATLVDAPVFRTVYPNKVFDHMAAGRPTVLAIRGVIRDVVEKANAGIPIQPGDANDLTSAVLRFYTDEALRHHMGRDARSYVERHFERREQARDMECVLDRVLERQYVSKR